MGAAAMIGSGILGAGSQIFGALSGASAQKKAAQAATNAQLSMFNQLAGYLQPYREAGQPYANYMKQNLDSLIAPVRLDQQALEQTPGYQFTLKQGLKSVQNSAAARGLGSSGAAYKGAADYSTGLANNTWKDVFNAETMNKQNTWNRLLQGSTLGANAAAMTGQGAMQTGQGMANNLMSAGNAQAGAMTSAGNSLAGLFNNIGGYYGYKGLFGGDNGGMYGNNAYAGYNMTGLPGNAV